MHHYGFWNCQRICAGPISQNFEPGAIETTEELKVVKLGILHRYKEQYQDLRFFDLTDTWMETSNDWC